MDSQAPAQGSQVQSHSDRLESWKEIAGHLRRDVRTVQHWETEEGLPVHRHVHGKLASVYAFRSEIDAWLASRKPLNASPAAAATLPLATATRFKSRRQLQQHAIYFVAGLVIVVVLVGTGWYVWRRGNNRPSVPIGNGTLAVLPFVNLSPADREQHVVDGLTDDLITDLGRTGQLRVIARTSVMQFKGNNESLPQIAKALNANLIVEGAMVHDGDSVRITAQLIDAATNHLLWANSYESTYSSVLGLQDDVAGNIAVAISERLTGTSGAPPTTTQPVDPLARLAFLKGRSYLERRDEPGLKAAITSFDDAIAKDKDYAAAYAGLAEAYALLSGWGDLSSEESFGKSRAAALRALELDPMNSEAHAALGLVETYDDWNWLAAQKEFVRAIQLDPADATARQWYAYCLLLQGQRDKAVREIHAAEVIDPLSSIVNTDVAQVFLTIGQNAAAAEQARKTLQLDSSFAPAHQVLGLAYLQMSRFPDAIHELKQAATLSWDSPVALSNLGYAYAVAHQEPQARYVLAKLKELSEREHVNGERFALIYAGMGQDEKAVLWFQNAFSDHDRSEFCSSMVLPAFDRLRSDPRFRQFLRHIGFPLPPHSKIDMAIRGGEK